MSPAPIAFGTDGVRGPFGAFPIDSAGARQIGLGAAAWFRAGASPPKVAIGWDPRASSEALVEALVGGLIDGGATAIRCGMMPTAAVSCAAAGMGCDAGVMVTASHNPWSDNGIKVLAGDGRKLRDTAGLEHAFLSAAPRPGGSVHDATDPLQFWRAQLPTLDLSGLALMVDCANGAAARCAPAALRGMGATVTARGCSPDGRNINAGVGAMHPPSPGEVRAAGCTLAICLDGDADRVILVDPDAGLLDGDDILWMLAGASDGPVIGTVMSNGGLEEALGDRLHRARVGDKHVAALMATTGARWGAEPSGHVLFSDGMPTGDGLYAALRVLAATCPPGSTRPALPLSTGAWRRWPVAKRNLRFTGARIPVDTLSTVKAATAEGYRVVARYSGTEPVFRVLVEGPDGPERWVDAIAQEFDSASAGGRR